MTDAIHSIAAARSAPGCSAYTYMVRSYARSARALPSIFGIRSYKLTETSYDFLTGWAVSCRSSSTASPGSVRRLTPCALIPISPAAHRYHAAQSCLAGAVVHAAHWAQRFRVTLTSGAPMQVIFPVKEDSCHRCAARDSHATFRSATTADLLRCRPITASSSAPGSPAVAASTAFRHGVGRCDAHATLTINIERTVSIAKVTVQRGSRNPYRTTSRSPSMASTGSL